MLLVIDENKIFSLIPNQPKTPKKVRAVLQKDATVAPTLSHNKLWSLIQNWRLHEGRQSYIKDQVLCDFAKERLIEINIDQSHDNFYPKASVWFPNKKVSENLAYTYNFEEGVLAGWLNSPTHKANLVANYTHSCLVCAHKNCVQIFTSY